MQTLNDYIKALRSHMSALQDNGIHLNTLIVDEPKPDDTLRLREEEMRLQIKASANYFMPVFPSSPSLLNIPIHPEPKPEISIDEIQQRVDKQTLFLFAYVPFVIAEVAWDYADTCINLAILLRITETKKLCRRIRELRREYDHKRAMIDREHRETETKNMITFQEDYKEFFGKLHGAIQGQVNAVYPGQCMDMQFLICAAYSCAVVLRSMFKYVDTMSKRIAALLGIQAIGSIIIGEIRQLEAIILQFAGEESIGGDNKFPTSLNPYIDTLVQYLLQSEMIELPSPIED